MAGTRPPWIPAFLEAYRQTGIIAASARAAGIGRVTVHRYLERHPEDRLHEEMRQAKTEAKEAMELVAMHRAKVGVSKPVFYKGRQVGSFLEPSDQLLMFMLRAMDPATYRERYDVTVGGRVVVESEVDAALRAAYEEHLRLAGGVAAPRRPSQDPGAGEVGSPEPLPPVGP